MGIIRDIMDIIIIIRRRVRRMKARGGGEGIRDVILLDVGRTLLLEVMRMMDRVSLRRVRRRRRRWGHLRLRRWMVRIFPVRGQKVVWALLERGSLWLLMRKKGWDPFVVFRVRA